MLQHVGTLPTEARITFYVQFAHTLTVAVRGIWSDATIPVPDQLAQLTWMNEVMHRVLNHLRALHAGRAWSEDDMWHTLQHTIAQCPAINSEVGGALQSAYAATVQPTMEP